MAGERKSRMTYKEAAELSGLHYKTISKYANREYFKVVRLAKNTVFILRDSWDAFWKQLEAGENMRGPGDPPYTGAAAARDLQLCTASRS